MHPGPTCTRKIRPFSAIARASSEACGCVKPGRQHGRAAPVSPLAGTRSARLWQQDDPGGVSEGLARQQQHGRAEKHQSPSADDADLGRSLHLPEASLCPKATRRTDQAKRQATDDQDEKRSVLLGSSQTPVEQSG